MNTILQIITRITLCGTLWLLASGCEEFLTKNDPSNFTVDTYFTAPEHAVSAVNSIYQDLREGKGGGFGGAPWMMLEFQTGLANTELGQADNSIIIRNLQNTSDNSYGNTFWVSHYHGIANANLALAKIPDIEMDPVQKERLLGEARFLRAYYYFNLVRIFGEIPLIDETVDLSSEELYPGESPIQDIYDLIVEDLTRAEDAGLPFRDQDGRASLGATKSLLANVYLTMAGYPLNGGSQYYELARDKAKEVIDAGEYTLFSDYNDLHDEATENLGEHIFMVQFNRTDHNSDGLQVSIIPYNQGISLYSAETGAIFAQREFIESYEPGDKRVEEKEFYYRTFSLEADRSQTVDLGGWYIFKHMDVAAHTTNAVTGLNWPLIRYAEVLLTYAEASNEVSGPTAEAYEAVNQIRRRAEIPELAGLDQNTFREAIWRERWHELSYENITWFDMVRLRKAFNVETLEFEDYVGHTFVYGPTLTERELLFPIPTNEVRNNEKLTQNPGY
uniref:RagB/SusD family nutrient uptake outer membrane protein n=1 Tax=Roseihalotalea indica TaxID=2867963 RepID=A0AA49GK88_9BACT|nr:RagB/SusD family nutrient uptake outer membrane protein [Tunicatimonas sp. TK19036]